jgi:VCBS repeat protein
MVVLRTSFRARGSFALMFFFLPMVAGLDVQNAAGADIGDFNADGRQDLNWQNVSTRQVIVWYMGGAGGATLESWNWLDNAGHPGWHMIAAADFDGNGVPDLVWQNDSTSQVLVWYMGGLGGVTLLNTNYLDSVGHPGWHVVAAAWAD